MRRGTTVTLDIYIPSIKNSDIKSLYVTIVQGLAVVEKNIDDMKISDDKITVFFSQEDTLAFAVGSANLQIRGVTNSKNSFASAVKRVQILQILKDGVIS